MKKFTLSITVFSTFLLLSSCVGNKKIARLNNALEGYKKLEAKLDSTLTSLSNLSKDKNAKGELDDTSTLAINKMLEKEMLASKQRNDSLTQLQTKVLAKQVKVREYKNMVAVMTAGPYIVTEKMESVDFIDQLLKQETFIKFNTAAFFPPGGYQISPDKLNDAKAVFSPIVDSLISFVQRFPQMTLTSSIIASGYADGQGFSPGPLVNTLTASMGKTTEATKEELNMELSRLRAEEVAGILLGIFKDKVSKLPSSSSLNAQFFKTGKGEEYPNKKIADYQVDDERRRIVVIYWNSLPKQ